MKEKMNVKKVCEVCDQEKKEGITLYRSFICIDCEQEMIHTDPGDERYQYFVDKLKVINQSTQIS